MHDPLAHIRAEVLAQPEAERTDYALDLLAFYLDPVPAFFEGCVVLGINLPMAEVRMLYALDRRRGRYVSLEGLMAARNLDRPCDEWASTAKAVEGICSLRARLAKLGLPVEIKTRRSLGYVLEAPAQFRFECSASAIQAVAL